MAIEIVVAEHRVDVATQLLTQTRHVFEAGHAIAVGAPAIVARQHTKVIVEVEHEFSGPAHGGAAYVRVQVTQVQNGEAIESTWQIWEANGITLQLHLARVCPAPPIGPRQAKRYLDRRLHQRQVLEMQEAEPLAEEPVLRARARFRGGAVRAKVQVGSRDGEMLRRDRVSDGSSRCRLRRSAQFLNNYITASGRPTKEPSMHLAHPTAAATEGNSSIVLAYNTRVVVNVGEEDHCEPADGDHCSGTPALRRASRVRSIWTRYVGSSLIAVQAAPTRETV